MQESVTNFSINILMSVFPQLLFHKSIGGINTATRGSTTPREGGQTARTTTIDPRYHLTLLASSTRFLISSSTPVTNFRSFLREETNRKEYLEFLICWISFTDNDDDGGPVKNELEKVEVLKDKPGVLFEAVAVYGGRADVEGVRRWVDLQCLCQTPVSLQSSTLLVTFKP